MLDRSHMVFLVLCGAILLFSFRDLAKSADEQQDQQTEKTSDGQLNMHDDNEEPLKKIPSLKIKSNVQTLKFLFW